LLLGCVMVRECVTRGQGLYDAVMNRGDRTHDAHGTLLLVLLPQQLQNSTLHTAPLSDGAAVPRPMSCCPPPFHPHPHPPIFRLTGTTQVMTWTPHCCCVSRYRTLCHYLTRLLCLTLCHAVLCCAPPQQPQIDRDNGDDLDATLLLRQQIENSNLPSELKRSELITGPAWDELLLNVNRTVKVRGVCVCLDQQSLDPPGMRVLGWARGGVSE
jgi:hypothetical protein